MDFSVKSPYFISMTIKTRTIEIDAKTAELLEKRAASEGVSVADLLAEVFADQELPPDLEAMRAAGQGPWSPEVLDEDERELAELKRTGVGVPLDETLAWMDSLGTPNQLPRPKPRKL